MDVLGQDSATKELDIPDTSIGMTDVWPPAQSADDNADALRSRIHLLESQLSQSKVDASTLAHELRTPLTAIGASIGLVLSEMTGQINSEAKEILEVCYRNARRMERLVTVMVEMARQESGNLSTELKPINLAVLVKGVLDELSPVAAGTDTELIAHINPSIRTMANHDRIVQVLTNLLGNAIKYAPGGPVVIGAVQGKDEVQVSVTDVGPGIPPENIDTIFDRFSQANPDMTEGAGLGLEICKSIVEAHTGRIWAESHLGHGTRITFTLPAV